MSLAIKFGDNKDPEQLSGFIFFDVVTKYSRNVDGQLTKHPLDAGVKISDHFISENPKFNIVGVISSADVTSIPENMILDGERPLNYQPQPTAVEVKTPSNILQKVLPGPVSQLFTKTLPSISIGGNRQSNVKQVEDLLRKLLSGVVYDEKEKKLKNRMSLTTLYSYDQQGVLVIEEEDLVVTSMSVEEDPENGDALFLALTLEQPRFVSLEKTELPKDVSSSLSKAAQTTSKKSKVDSTVKKSTDTSKPAAGEVAPQTEEAQRAAQRAAATRDRDDAIKAIKILRG